ncbi:hypothetical protein W97_05644 [Coniosporium apollinis CBS 100218]|uniref:Cytochrome P450 oxidoreductase n=1 Tax=Coniosporium apollinis (strain CBS 100218) TaxID=1168221 RepID=R7YX64_CONA1|nr:uncharacterized protein W97_05644 [Coniosporium apollinis CBS 100218]EON66251.1 hypothetical protein W97_05644 [Coniosporium apollinis CBS 100218]
MNALPAAGVSDFQTVGIAVNEPLLNIATTVAGLAPVLAIASVAFLILALVNRIRAYRRLAHIPGPRLAGFSRLWMVRANISGRNHEYLAEVTAKYGSLARIGPNHLLTSDEDLIRRINAPRSLYRRSGWYSTFRFKPRADSLISEVNEEKHDELRRKMAPGYSGKEVPYLENYVDKHIGKWVEVIRQRYVSTGRELKPMDLGRAAQYFTLDVISDLAFNRPFGDLEADADKFDYIKVTADAMGVMMLLTIFPGVHRWIEASYLVDLVAPSAKDKTGLGRVVGVAQQEIAPRYNDLDQKDSQDMLGSFIRHGLTQEEAESNSVLQMSVELHLLPEAPADSTIHSMAGSDTSATVIRALFLYLITSPLVLAKLRSEIDDAIRDGRISSPIRDSEARQLPYLQACIREALRIHPPVTGILEKVVPPEGDTVNGVFIPGGTFIGQCTWAFGRNVDIYGSDVELFRPERWLEAQGEELRRMERNVDLVFSSGRFQCLGKPVALLELNKVFVELLRRFDISVINPYKPLVSDNRGLFLQKDFWVRITEREDRL